MTLLGLVGLVGWVGLVGLVGLLELVGWNGDLGRGGRRGLVPRLPLQTGAARQPWTVAGSDVAVADSGFLVADSGFLVAHAWWPIQAAVVADSGLRGGRFGPVWWPIRAAPHRHDLAQAVILSELYM